MASLDFVRDYRDTLNKENIQYIIITLQEYKDHDSIDAFINIKNQESFNKISAGIHQKLKEIKIDKPKQ
jgi:hypothetical protein